MSDAISDVFITVLLYHIEALLLLVNIKVSEWYGKGWILITNMEASIFLANKSAASALLSTNFQKHMGHFFYSTVIKYHSRHVYIFTPKMVRPEYTFLSIHI